MPSDLADILTFAFGVSAAAYVLHIVAPWVQKRAAEYTTRPY